MVRASRQVSILIRLSKFLLFANFKCVPNEDHAFLKENMWSPSNVVATAKAKANQRCPSFKGAKTCYEASTVAVIDEDTLALTLTDETEQVWRTMLSEPWAMGPQPRDGVRNRVKDAGGICKWVKAEDN